MPPRRPARGRHRRPKNHGGPAYLTAATLTAFTVGGMNMPNALGDARQASNTTVAAAATTASPQRTVVSAEQIRQTLAQTSQKRVSRLERGQTELAELGEEAAEQIAAEAEARRPKWVLPVTGFRLTAGFGEWGLWSSAHTGQDFAAAYGTPVRSIGDGTIISAEYEGAYGYKLVVRHEDGTESWYAHLAGFERTSGRVKAGEMVGRMGSTGNSTGNHLHLEVRPGGGDPVPPLTWLRRHGVRI